MKSLFKFFAILLVFGCTQKETISLRVLNLDGKFSSIEGLLFDGFQKTQVDVLMFEKKNGDTTVYFNYGFQEETVENIYWEFPILKKDSRNKIKAFFKKKNCYLNLSSDGENKQEISSFYFQNNFSRELFFVRLESLDSLNSRAIIKYDFRRN